MGVNQRESKRPSATIKHAEQEEIKRLTEEYLAAGNVIKKYGTTPVDLEKLKKVDKEAFGTANKKMFNREKFENKKQKTENKINKREQAVEERKKRLLELRREGLGDKEVMERLKCTANTYRDYCDQLGIDTVATEKAKKIRKEKITKIKDLYNKGWSRDNIRKEVSRSWAFVKGVTCGEITE